MLIYTKPYLIALNCILKIHIIKTKESKFIFMHKCYLKLSFPDLINRGK